MEDTIDANTLSIDIETACGVGCEVKCDHALDPFRSRITCIGVVNLSGSIQRVYRDLDKFKYDILEGDLSAYTFGGQGFKFDALHLRAKQVTLPLERWIWDSQLSSSVHEDAVSDEYMEEYEVKRKELNKSLPKGTTHRPGRRHSLKVIAPYYLGVEPFWENPGNHDDDEYVLKDCKYALQMEQYFRRRMPDPTARFLDNKLLPWTKLLVRSEYRGVSIDLKQMAIVEAEEQAKFQEAKRDIERHWRKYFLEHKYNKEQEVKDNYSNLLSNALAKVKTTKVKYRTKAGVKYKDVVALTQEEVKAKRDAVTLRYAQLRQQALQRVDTTFNLNSDDHMMWLLRDRLELDVRNYKDEETTGAEVLERLASEGREDIKRYLDYRASNKILTSYFPSYKEKAHECVIHPTFNPTGTRTGRLSSSNPNLQQVPEHLRKLFVPRDGYSFVGYDESAIEARLIALYTQDPVLLDIVEKGWSIHDYNAKVFFSLDCEIDEVKSLYPAERQAAKRCGFSLFYGAGWRRISGAFLQGGLPMPEQRCKEIHENFKEAYKQAVSFHQDITEDFAQGATIYNLLGRPLTIARPQDAYMKGFNKLIQSSASDLCLQAAYKAQKKWDEEGTDAHVLLYVHDFIGVECKSEIAEHVERDLVNCMTNFTLTNGVIKIQLEVEGGVYSRWEK